MKIQKIHAALMLLVFLVGAVSLAQGASPADIVITNADIRTMDEANPKAQAVAITGNTIAYVGSSKGAQSFIGKETASSTRTAT